jgi:hypothetical protein
MDSTVQERIEDLTLVHFRMSVRHVPLREYRSKEDIEHRRTYTQTGSAHG